MGARGQRSAVKVGYVRNGKRGAWRAHGVYLAREGAQRGGARGLGFDATREGLDVAGTLGAWQEAGDRHLWKVIVSPEQAPRLDLRAHAQVLVAGMERDLGTRLEWVGIDHHNTDNPHVHLLIRGRDARGRPLTLDAQLLLIL
jgi:type IV secretory pathway VirD2 relaxase